MLLGLENVRFEFGARTIVDGANWQIQPGERVGLVGYNGTGKSTLLKLLTDHYAPASGKVVRPKNTRIGFLHQDLLNFQTDASLVEVVLGGIDTLRELTQKLHVLKEKLHTRPDDEKTLLDYADAMSAFDEAGGYGREYEAQSMLSALGFSKDDYERAYASLSGGWRMRVLLARILVGEPDVLLLDEPTNHLDLPSIEWFEKFLSAHKGSIVLVSHDKFFLSRVTNKIVELTQQKLHFYAGNYEFYEIEKRAREEIQQKAYENQQDYIRKQERFVERFRAQATKASQAQSVIKRLDKLERLDEVASAQTAMKVRFGTGITPGKIIASIRNFTKKFSEHTLLENAHADINRGQKIALLGANGIGKSTLLRAIVGTESFEGTIEKGHNVSFSFYAQHQLEQLDASRTVFEEALHGAPQGVTEQMVRNVLGGFLFNGDDIEKKIKILSGGERARVALCKLMLAQSNFLILDEPTNHLDLPSIERLADALRAYAGTVLFVSHDRYFTSQVANEIWHIENKSLQCFGGNFEEWHYIREKKLSEQNTTQQKNNNKKETANGTQQSASNLKNDKDKNKIDYNKDKKNSANNIHIVAEKEIKKIEEKLARARAKTDELAYTLATPALINDRVQYAEVEKKYHESSARVRDLEAEYELVFNRLFS